MNMTGSFDRAESREVGVRDSRDLRASTELRSSVDVRESTGSNFILGGLKEKIQREKDERKLDIPLPMKYKK